MLVENKLTIDGKTVDEVHTINCHGVNMTVYAHHSQSDKTITHYFVDNITNEVVFSESTKTELNGSNIDVLIWFENNTKEV